MQRLFSLKHPSSNSSKKLIISTNSSLPLSHLCYNAFTSLAKSTHHGHRQQSYIFGLSLFNPVHLFHSCHSQHTLSRKVHGFLSNPWLPKQFMSNVSNTHFKFLTKGRAGYKFGISRTGFSRGYSGLKHGFGSGGRSWRSWFNRVPADNMVLGLVSINVAVFTLWQIADKKFMADNFMISMDNFRSGRLHTLITSSFSHVDAGHYISNTCVLYFFGRKIGRTLGPKYLLKLYLAGALGGSLFYLLHHVFMALSTKGQGMSEKDTSGTPGLGSSGAVNAILMLEILLHPGSTIYLQFIIPVRAALVGVLIIGIDLFRVWQGNSKVSGSTHLGGLAVAAIAYGRIKKGRL